MKLTKSLVIIGVLIASHVYGARFCVTTSSELVNAINSAESNGQNNVIKIAQGSYDAPVGGLDINDYAGYIGNVTVENNALFSDEARFPVGSEATSLW